ncbi:hypothetical protein C5749_00270 [Sphingobacterium gobiense]|uniref:Uncharacterized protein n=2 Tax=Sphingobacterium gobiense TaxID=1382456 RepID=A0A2S9JR58_9SPHI|nr:hypothetical protein C5749_00270 [Sphingobacterium gobiense]
MVSKGIYLFDAKNGEKLAYAGTKDLGTGTVKYSHFYDGEVLLFGISGVGLLDFEGHIVASIPAKNVKGFAATGEEIWLLENRKLTRVDAQQGI